MLVLLHSWSMQFYTGTREQEARRVVCGSLGTPRDPLRGWHYTNWRYAHKQCNQASTRTGHQHGFVL